MNDKERLQKIQWFKEFYRLDRFSNPNEPYLPSATDISYDDLLWLVGQAERAEQLQQEIARITKERDQYFDDKILWSGYLKIKDQELQQAQAKAKRYKEALKEIAQFCNDGIYEGKEFVYIARQALKGDES